MYWAPWWWVPPAYTTQTDLRLLVVSVQFSSVQLLSHVQLFVTPWIAARQASLSITNSRSSLKLTSIESVMPTSHLILCRPLLLLPSIFPSITVFSNESALRIRGPKYWSFSFSISPSGEHLGLISFRMDWLELFAVQGTLKHLLQHLLLFNMLSKVVITFLPRNKCLLISWLQSPSAVILEPPKIKSDTVSTVSLSIFHEVMGPDAMILVFWMLSFKPTFSTLLFHFHQEAFQFFFTFCHKGGVICISEVIDISPGNLDSSLCFFQSRVSHDVLCI